MENTTAPVSCFARAYHTKHSATPVFSDPAAEKLIGDDYEKITASMTAGAGFFLPGFSGSPEEALRRIAEGQLAPTVLARSAFADNALKTETRLGARQVLLAASGYDTLAVRNMDPRLTFYELDRESVLADKAARLERAGLEGRAVAVPCDFTEADLEQKLSAAGYRTDVKTFAILNGISYYLTDADFAALIARLGKLMPEGSAVVFDYPMREESREAGINRVLAEAAGEPMRSAYTCAELETVLSENGFLIYEHLDPKEMTARFFSTRNAADPAHPLAATGGVGYVLAVRKG